MNRIVILALLLVSVVSCKKEEVKNSPMNPTQGTGIMVEGIVRDSLTGNPLSGVLLGTYSSNGYENFNYLTGLDGYYRQYINWTWSKPLTFVAQLADTMYYNATPPVSLAPYEIGDTIQQDILRVPYSRVNIHVVTQSINDNYFITDISVVDPLYSWQGIIHVGNGSVDTNIVRYLPAYTSRNLKFYPNGLEYSDTLVQTGYGTVHNIEIIYP